MKKALVSLLRAWLCPIGLVGLIRGMSLGWRLFPEALRWTRVMVFLLLFVVFIFLLFTMGETMNFLRFFFSFAIGDEPDKKGYASFFSTARRQLPLFSGNWTYAALPIIELILGACCCALSVRLLRLSPPIGKWVWEFPLYAAVGLFMFIDGIVLFARRNKWY